MATQMELKKHFLCLSNAVYVWGANCRRITKKYIKQLYNNYGNSTYNKKYYDNKLKEGEGKIGADCSGSLCPISGYDLTANAYYSRCVEKGVIATIPRNKVCLVFKKNLLGKINHVGCYTGDGYVSEMASSKKNYQRKPLDGNGWSLWGMPDFISNPNEVMMEQLEVDGYWGKSTTLATQKAYGTKEDGEISNQKSFFKSHLPNARKSSWEFVLRPKRGSQIITAIQTDLKEKCYYKGIISGWCDKKTVMAIQTFLGACGYYNGKIDGRMDKKTVKGWQMYINSRM